MKIEDADQCPPVWCGRRSGPCCGTPGQQTPSISQERAHLGDQTCPRHGQLLQVLRLQAPGPLLTPVHHSLPQQLGASGGRVGFPTQDDALDRLTAIYSEKRRTPIQQAELKRETGKQRFGQYAASWLPRQRHYAAGSIRTVNQLLDSQILPILDSRRVNTFSSTVIEDFILSMEDRGVGLATQQNAFDTLKKILLDALRRGGMDEDPFDGVVPPEYVPNPITIPTIEEIHAIKASGSDGLRVVIDLMSGCGHRNGEAYAANTERLVADDVYRITEQIDGKIREPARLKHRKPGEYRETPMAPLVRQSILTYVDKYGVSPGGYILQTQRSKLLGPFDT